jgi:pimeloyl-ACP methyl ester carboxylesterase
MHGSWCWKYVLEELAALGVPAIAPDLPGHGERTNEPATLDGYRKALPDVLEPDNVLAVWASHFPLINRPKELARQLVTIAAN